MEQLLEPAHNSKQVNILKQLCMINFQQSQDGQHQTLTPAFIVITYNMKQYLPLNFPLPLEPSYHTYHPNHLALYWLLRQRHHHPYSNRSQG